MKRTKLKFAIIGVVVLILLAGAFILFDQWDPMLWGLWFAAFDGIVLQYSMANVLQKKVLKAEDMGEGPPHV